MEDHVCFYTVSGKPTLIAIDVSYREDSGYAPVEEPLPDALLGKYFKYDPDTRSYKRSDKAIPTAFACQDIREHLCTHGSILTAFTTFATSEAQARAVTVVASSSPSLSMRI